MSRINTNVASLVANRTFAKNQVSLNESLHRLSTGLRINSAKDDPAGLIASERLRAENAALTAAIDNASRADNMVAVAEGGLQEISSLLTQLESLIDHTANTAGLSSEEVAANQLQVDTILDSINRIAASTEFGDKKLLNGSLDYTTSSLTVGATATATSFRINSARLNPGSTTAVLMKVTTSAQTGKLFFNGTATGAGVTTLQITGKTGSDQFSFASGTKSSAVIAAINSSKNLTGVSAAISGAGAAMWIKLYSTDYGSDAFVSVQALSGTFTTKLSATGANATKDSGQDVVATLNGIAGVGKGLSVSVRSSSLSADFTLSTAFATQTAATKTFGITGGGANFSIGPNLGLAAQASLGLQNVAAGSLGDAKQGYLSSLGTGQTNQLSNTANYKTAQEIVRNAIGIVSTMRGRLGSFQKNTLTPTMNALQIAYENVSAAESAIRDTDFAEETSNLTRSQILVQAATSVLQQANASPQNALALLQ